MVLAAWIEHALDGYYTGQSQWRRQTSREREASARLTAFNELITNLVGIEEVYRSGSTKMVQQLDYAKDVSDAVENSGTVRIASIAGYQFLGAGRKSLLFDVLRNKPNCNVEVVVLDPIERNDIVKERAKALKVISADYTPGKLVQEIDKTKEALEALVESRSTGDGYVKYFKTKLNPAFRIILTDAAVFVSAYQSNCHGHQAPVLKIRKSFPEDGPVGMSLYAAFAAHFENLKRDAEPVIDKDF